MDKKVRKNYFGEGYTVTDEHGNGERFEKDLIGNGYTSDKGRHVRKHVLDDGYTVQDSDGRSEDFYRGLFNGEYNGSKGTDIYSRESFFGDGTTVTENRADDIAPVFGAGNASNAAGGMNPGNPMNAAQAGYTGTDLCRSAAAVTHSSDLGQGDSPLPHVSAVDMQRSAMYIKKVQENEDRQSRWQIIGIVLFVLMAGYVIAGMIWKSLPGSPGFMSVLLTVATLQLAFFCGMNTFEEFGMFFCGWLVSTVLQVLVRVYPRDGVRPSSPWGDALKIQGIVFGIALVFFVAGTIRNNMAEKRIHKELYHK